MSAGQYEAVRIICREAVQGPSGETSRIWMEVAEGPNGSARGELLVIRTDVSAPVAGHPRGWELAALARVHALLGDQIKKMR